jgi:glycosyltransferase involved in cell wall biosynthesis
MQTAQSFAASTPVRRNIIVVGSPLSGTVQGHSLLAVYLEQNAGLRSVRFSGTPVQRMIARGLRIFARVARTSPLPYEVFLYELHRRSAPNAYFHFIWGDEIVCRLARSNRAIFTVHQPHEKWDQKTWDGLQNAVGFVGMAEREVELVRNRFPEITAEFIPHGVDIDFWKPDPAEGHSVRQPVVCAVGRYMRNYEMMLRVAVQLLQARPNLVFRWLVNPDFDLPANVRAGLPADRFEVVRNLAPEALRSFYRKSSAMFMPYDNVTASNAIVEAMSTGTPIVTTDVGGMRSYVGEGTTLVNNNDDHAAIGAIGRLLDDDAFRAEESVASRSFAQRTFAWPLIVERHAKFYETVIGNMRPASKAVTIRSER